MIQMALMFLFVLGVLLIDKHIEDSYSEEEPAYTYKPTEKNPRHKFTWAGGKPKSNA